MPTRYPVALFAHRRAEELAQSLEALRQAGVPRIYAYVDGSRGPADDAGHSAVLDLLRGIAWAEVTLVARDRNVGLQASIRGGLDDFFAREEAGVVVEEDIRLAPGAYAWMCDALARFAGEHQVGAISAWAHPRFIPPGAAGPWWSARWSGWGWAGWRRTWALMSESVDDVLARLDREGFDAASYGEDVVTVARLGQWDAHLALLLYGAHMLTLYPPRSLADHIGVGVGASHQHHAGQWRAVPAAPLTEQWPWPATVTEHPASAALWRRAVVADQQRPRAHALAARIRRRLGVLWHRVARAWRQWPEALALRLTLVLFRARRARPYEDDLRGATTPIRFLWNDFLWRQRDAFFGRGLEIGDARMTAAVGGTQMERCEVVDLVAREGVDYVVDLQHGWALPENAFDVFLCQFTVHVVGDDRALLWHALRALRPEGTLLVNFSCGGTAAYDGAEQGHESTRVYRWYTAPGVSALLAELGLDEHHAEVEPLGGAAAVAAYLLGVPAEAMSRTALRRVDPESPLLIAARITKPVHWAPAWSPPPAPGQ